MTSEATPSSSTRRVEIVNAAGLHARPCHAIVQTAMGFPCGLRIRRADGPADDPGVNGKSILELMVLEAAQGTVLELQGEGEGAGEMLDSLEALFQRGFGEE